MGGVCCSGSWGLWICAIDRAGCLVINVADLIWETELNLRIGIGANNQLVFLIKENFGWNTTNHAFYDSSNMSKWVWSCGQIHQDIDNDWVPLFLGQFNRRANVNLVAKPMVYAG